VILPSATYTEKSGTYVNTEGRVQIAERAVFPPGEAKEDWAIFRALSAVLGMPLPFNSLRALRTAIYAEFPHLAQIDQIVPAGIDGTRELAGRATKTDAAKLTSPIGDFYMTNPIARASAIMAECSQMQAGLKQAAE
jgi:NADH-quinone oxidoreductase subunit G